MDKKRIWLVVVAVVLTGLCTAGWIGVKNGWFGDVKSPVVEKIPVVGKIFADKPLSVTMVLEEEVSKSITSILKLTERNKDKIILSGSRHISLILTDVVPPKGNKGVRVFLNLDADLDTSLEVPNYVGSFAFYPQDEPATHIIELRRVLHKMQDAGQLDLSKPFKFVFVVIPDGESKPRLETIGKIGIEAGKVKQEQGC